MAAPSYGTDLVDSGHVITDSEAATFTEPTGFTDGAVTNGDTDNYIQGTKATAKSMAAGAASVSGVIFNYGSGITLGATDVVLVWIYFSAPPALETLANGGLRLLVGNATTAFRQWYINGKDIYTYGGWRCIPVYVNNTTYDNTTGSPNGTWQYFGAAAVENATSAVSKGSPLSVDTFRWGRGEARFSNGSLADGYATFAGYATQNDNQSNRWGLIQAIDGGYLWQGLITIGYNSVACAFTDSNRNISIADTRKVQSGFNKIEIRTTGTVVNWTNIAFTCISPSTTASKGALEVVTDVSVTMTSCSFTDMTTFIYKGSSSLVTTIFRRCGLVTGGGANFDRCTFEETTGTSAVVVADLGKLDYCTFSKLSAATSHGVELTTAGSYTWTGTGTGYDSGSTGSPVTPTSTGKELIYVSATGGTVDISVATGATIPSIKSAGATVNVSAGAVTATVTVTTESGTAISGAAIALYAKDATGPMPYDETVTISNSGTTATVTHTGHGMITNDKVLIAGASLPANNGVFTITYIGANSYSYTMGSTPGSSPTGTIKATWAALYGTSGGDGTLTLSRVFAADQPVSGWARKSTTAPYYKTGPISGTIDSGTGVSLTALLLSDE